MGLALAVILLGSTLSVMQLFGVMAIVLSLYGVAQGSEDDGSVAGGQRATDSDMRGAVPNRVCASPAATNPTAS